jgi:hypothetical protein
MYDITSSEDPAAEKFTALKQYKAKIINIHARKTIRMMLDLENPDQMENEEQYSTF